MERKYFFLVVALMVIASQTTLFSQNTMIPILRMSKPIAGGTVNNVQVVDRKAGPLTVSGKMVKLVVYGPTGKDTVQILTDLNNVATYDTVAKQWKNGGNIFFPPTMSNTYVYERTTINGVDYASASVGIDNSYSVLKRNTSNNTYEFTDIRLNGYPSRMLDWGNGLILLIGGFNVVNNTLCSGMVLWNPTTNALTPVGDNTLGYGIPGGVYCFAVDTAETAVFCITVSNTDFYRYRLLKKGQTTFTQTLPPVLFYPGRVALADPTTVFLCKDIPEASWDAELYTVKNGYWNALFRLNLQEYQQGQSTIVSGLGVAQGKLYVSGSFDHFNTLSPCNHAISYDIATTVIENAAQNNVWTPWLRQVKNEVFFIGAEDRYQLNFDGQSLFQLKDTTRPIVMITGPDVCETQTTVTGITNSDAKTVSLYRLVQHSGSQASVDTVFINKINMIGTSWGIPCTLPLGTNTVVAYATDGATNKSSPAVRTIQVTTATAVGDIPTQQNATVTMYPNPVMRNASVTITNTIALIEVYDLLGKQYALPLVQKNGTTLTCKFPFSGMYLLVVKTKNGIKETKKILVE